VLGAKGLRGAVRIEPLTDRPGRFDVGEVLLLDGEDRPRRVIAYEPGGRSPAVQLEGIRSREEAEAIVGRYLEIEAEALPEGTYYWHQLVGLTVTDETGAPLGQVAEVFRAGENEVYRVEGPAGELLLPSLHDVVRSIDLAAGVMVVRYEDEEVR
jgi:16S rRNA processing protein RimM